MNTLIQIKLIIAGLTIATLNPVTSDAQVPWEKYPDNPVLSSAPWASSVKHPFVIYEDGVYKMWFAGPHGAGTGIGYAVSTDGIDWDPNEDKVIPSGAPLSWNQDKLPSSVLKVNDTLRMWFSASYDAFSLNSSIGYAWSLGNNDWNVWPNRVFEHGKPGTWDETAVFKPVVYHDGNMYHMWYHGWAGFSTTAPGSIGYASSADGLHWIRDTINNPVIGLGEPGSFFDTWVIPSSVLFMDNIYHLWFTGWDGHSTNPFRYFKTGYAISENGIEWTVQNNSIPVLDVGAFGEWDDKRAQYASVLYQDGIWRLWYEGKGDTTRIGFAMWPAPWFGIHDLRIDSTIQATISPNPCEDRAQLRFTTHKSRFTTIGLYDISGRKIQGVIDEEVMSGEHQIEIDVIDIPDGLYVVRVQAGNKNAMLKLVVVN